MLVSPVPVHICNRKVVKAIAKPGATAIVFIPSPAQCQFVSGRIHVQRTHLMSSVATSSEENARFASVQIRCAKIVLAGAVSSVSCLAPNSAVVALPCLETGKRVIHRRELAARLVPAVRLAGLPVQVEQVLRPIAGIFVSWSHIVHVANVHHLSTRQMENHVVCTSHEALGLSVHVPIVCHEIPLLVRTSHEVGTEVYPPKSPAIQRVALIVVKPRGVARITYVARIVALHKKLHHAIAIHIAQRHVVEHILARYVTSVAIYDRCHLDVEISIFPSGNFLALQVCRLVALHDRHYMIATAGSAARVTVVRCLQVLGKQSAVAIKIVGDVIILFAQHSPTHEVAALSPRNSNNATVYLVGKALRKAHEG